LHADQWRETCHIQAHPCAKVSRLFQAYTNTYADVQALETLYDEALAEPNMVGLSVGTRPDCVAQEVLDLLLRYQQRGLVVWLELGLQSAFDATLKRVNRGHGHRRAEAAPAACGETHHASGGVAVSRNQLLM